MVKGRGRSNGLTRARGVHHGNAVLGAWIHRRTAVVRQVLLEGEYFVSFLVSVRSWCPPAFAGTRVVWEADNVAPTRDLVVGLGRRNLQW